MIRQNLSRKTDIDRLNAWIAVNPEKAWAAMLAQGLQPWTIERIISGKQKGAPRPVTRRAFCRASGLAEDDLFPADQGEKQAV